MDTIESTYQGNAPIVLPKGLTWPGDEMQIPDWIYTDPQVAALEQERIFLGRHWNFVGLECEVPNPNDYIRSFVGAIPVVVARDADGAIHVFENRCSHRGAEFCRSYRGNGERFVCPYHNWTFDNRGKLVAIPFRRGVRGKGGMPDGFDMGEHDLRTFHVTTHNGVIFATACSDMESVEDYLGPEVLREFNTIFPGAEMKLLGIHRNTLPGNWKLYQENLKDPYHATLLHTYLTTFGLFVTSNESNVVTDQQGRHCVLMSRRPQGRPEVAKEEQADMQAFRQTMQLKDQRVLDYFREVDSPWTGSAITIWPNLSALRQQNILNTRLIVPRGPNELMMIWAVFGRATDDEAMVRHRLRQNNIFGPAGFLGIEDNEALKFVQDGLTRSLPRHGLAMLGDDREPVDTIITERAIRGMYRYYRQVMGF
ncbi:MAG: Rieske 2Fe-2S domain-containing protein [Alphaproteobacteria bacterium]|nr:Rieske 2Fe-2S domain-containing protein [Alphaproteobacteria bacterium]